MKPQKVTITNSLIYSLWKDYYRKNGIELIVKRLMVYSHIDKFYVILQLTLPNTSDIFF